MNSCFSPCPSRTRMTAGLVVACALVAVPVAGPPPASAAGAEGSLARVRPAQRSLPQSSSGRRRAPTWPSRQPMLIVSRPSATPATARPIFKTSTLRPSVR